MIKSKINKLFYERQKASEDVNPILYDEFIVEF